MVKEAANNIGGWFFKNSWAIVVVVVITEPLGRVHHVAEKGVCGIRHCKGCNREGRC